jgi:hypothetical protein
MTHGRPHSIDRIRPDFVTTTEMASSNPGPEIAT